MAKILYGGGVANMSGSEAGTVHSHNKGGTYTRQRTVPTNPQTTRQMAQRDKISNFSKEWVNDLDQSQRDAWTVFAQENPVIDRLGQSIFLSGIQMFVKLNARIAEASDIAINEPPLDLIVTQLTKASQSFDKGAGQISIDFLPDPMETDEHLQIFATPGVSAGVSNVKSKLRLVATSAAEAPSPVLFGVQWTAVFGALPPDGRKVVTMTRVLNSAKGAVSVPVRSDAIVIST